MKENKEETKLQSEQKTAEEMTVQEFSMLPLQAGLQVETPDGIGTYEGLTSSGIVTVFIDGGINTYPWNVCKPIVKLRHLEALESFVKKICHHLAEEARTNPPHKMHASQFKSQWEGGSNG